MAIELISEIVQKNNGTFPIVDSNNVKGGVYSVGTIEARNSIPAERRKLGMLCYVESEDEYYKLGSEGWEEAKFGGGGIPIYDLQMIEEEGDKLPDKYIKVPNRYTDLNRTNQSREIQQDGTYVDILFSALRKLLSEVAKLKNSFKYGINSYTGKDTAMSALVGNYNDPDEEPLWCIEEEDLSLLSELTIGEGVELLPLENVDITNEGVVKITNEAYWEDSDEVVLEAQDPKIFMYCTSSSLNIDIHLLSSTENTKVINLSDFGIPVVDTYNIMVCISRKVKNQGSNYIYISIGNALRSLIFKEGYLIDNSLISNPYYLEDSYTINKVSFNNLNLYKLNFYSKYQDFSRLVIPSMPTDENYKYGVAHLTIRSVKSENILREIQELLPNNELIFIEDARKLYIKNNDILINIGASGGSPNSGGMTTQDLLEELKKLGIIRQDGEDLRITDLADLTFIHQDTGSKFRFEVNGQGELTSTKIPNKSLADRVKEKLSENDITTLPDNVRGFIGQLRMKEAGKGNTDVPKDAKINADRLKIGAFYAPLSTDTIFGCSRAFIELENTADCDFPLEGCYLTYTRPNSNNEQVSYELPLKGTIKAGGTYLIVGKWYAKNEDANVYIKVDSYDLEWYVDGELLDTTVKVGSDKGYGFALTYGKIPGNEPHHVLLFTTTNTESLNTFSSSIGLKPNSFSSADFPYFYKSYFIDAIYYYNAVKKEETTPYWANFTVSITSNTMYRNMFFLDPAKQAFQGSNIKDSSRNRWKSGNDVWVVDLSKPFIKFPNSEDIYDISKLTPKASFLNKNVSYDKSKLDLNKPNMVNCAFGVNTNTRCFNWISVGYYDEYVWIRKQGTDTWKKFSSYVPTTEQITMSTEYPRRKEYSVELNNAAYARLTGRFPGDGTFYTAHKCVIELSETNNLENPEIWEYVVGRADGDNFDVEHSSKTQQFTLYPSDYKPMIYQITDQQGFHWIEYQVWNAAANTLEEKIKADCEGKELYPVIINTGDMTQNGTRINEWLDYYNGGYNLFNKYEHMAVVGNNDLCDINVSILGTGDDVGKSNSYYFHVFFCYDIDETIFTPIINGKYVPSLYYFDINNYRFLMVNSEFTKVTCEKWFKLTSGTKIANIYTGWSIDTLADCEYLADKLGFTPIYEMLYRITGNNPEKTYIAACHEMPFTVITEKSLNNNTIEPYKYRSISDTDTLVGSHLNQIDKGDFSVGTYWFSRLLEFRNIKLCIGGHKHTYACTYPIKENYKHYKDGAYVSSLDEPYTMPESLKFERTEDGKNVILWREIVENNGSITEGKNYSKLPYCKRDDELDVPILIFYPCTPISSTEWRESHGVIYFMCLATGYKLTSNKELPSTNQEFSQIIPKTTSDNKADTHLQYPMFLTIALADNEMKLNLYRIKNILNEKLKFSQYNYSLNKPTLEVFTQTFDINDKLNKYGDWKQDLLNTTTLII